MLHLVGPFLTVSVVLAFPAVEGLPQPLDSTSFVRDVVDSNPFASSVTRGLTSGSGLCSSHPTCIEEGYDDDEEYNRCCPTKWGCYRSCCDVQPEEGTCSTNSRCYDDGLRGECCPSGNYMSAELFIETLLSREHRLDCLRR